MPYLHKGVTYSEKGGRIISCIFCSIINKQLSGEIVLENSQFVAFKTIAPVSDFHVLICPRVHINNIDSLQNKAESSQLVKDMVLFGKETLRKNINSTEEELLFDTSYCFHKPPLNSIDHLHLHVIGKLHTRSWVGFYKYSTLFFWSISADEVIRKLQTQEENLLL